MLKAVNTTQVFQVILNQVYKFNFVHFREERAFLQEAIAMKMVSHPNVVSVYGVIKDPPTSTYCIVMEYMELGALTKLMKKVNIPWMVKVGTVARGKHGFLWEESFSVWHASLLCKTHPQKDGSNTA